MANKYNNDSICQDSNFIEKIKRRDQQIGGERLLDKLGNFIYLYLWNHYLLVQINNRVDYLKMKGFRLILQHEENKKKERHSKKKELSKINESNDFVRQPSIILNADILDK